MASSALQRILRRQSHSAAKLLSNFQKLAPLSLSEIPQIPKSIDSCRLERDYPIPSNYSNAYPTFSFSLFLNPNSPAYLTRSGPNDDSMTDDSVTIRADSVKKKRKKKMNKHKLSKLRKRLRKKTKT